MADIEELQRRITAALERIGKGVETLDVAAPSGPDPKEFEAISANLKAAEQALEEERVVTEQLQERVKALKSKLEDSEGVLRARLDAQSEATAQVDIELQRLRRANDQLRENNRALRAANEAGLADPHLINTAMIAELESLNATRAADIAEAAAIGSALEQLIKSEKPTEDA